MKVTRLAPVLVVEAIEPVLPFWERVGFAKTAEVPHDGALGFVILERDGIQVMYQTRASVAADVSAFSDIQAQQNYLFIEVDNLDEFVAALAGVAPVIPRRKTFYGSEEYIVRDGVGNTITFAQFGTTE